MSRGSSLRKPALADFPSTQDQYEATIHGRVASRGAMNEDNLSTPVAAVEAPFSTVDNSAQSGSRQPNDPVTAGTVRIVSDDTTNGALSRAYQLKCPSSACGDVNDATQWQEKAGHGACNGDISTSSCNAPGIKFTSNNITTLFMDKANTRFQSVLD